MQESPATVNTFWPPSGTNILRLILTLFSLSRTLKGKHLQRWKRNYEIIGVPTKRESRNLHHTHLLNAVWIKRKESSTSIVAWWRDKEEEEGMYTVTLLMRRLKMVLLAIREAIYIKTYHWNWCGIIGNELSRFWVERTSSIVSS